MKKKKKKLLLLPKISYDESSMMAGGGSGFLDSITLLQFLTDHAQAAHSVVDSVSGLSLADIK